MSGSGSSHSGVGEQSPGLLPILDLAKLRSEVSVPYFETIFFRFLTCANGNYFYLQRVLGLRIDRAVHAGPIFGPTWRPHWFGARIPCEIWAGWAEE